MLKDVFAVLKYDTVSISAKATDYVRSARDLAILFCVQALKVKQKAQATTRLAQLQLKKLFPCKLQLPL